MAARSAARKSGRAGRSAKARRKCAAPASAGSSPNGKYKNRGGWVEHRGKRFWIPSEAQLVRCLQLQKMEGEGRIGDLRFEVPIKLIVKNMLITTYRMDAIYQVLDELGRPLREVYEEVKGFETPEYKLKLRLFNALNPTPVTVLMVEGTAPEFDENGIRKRDEKGRAVRSTAEWMRQTWADRLPD